ncbi:MAG: LacI family DNA-binding transcriptional regulator [Candidatus Bipolaricaulia bacterium]
MGKTTIKDVAKLAGVSVATVSGVINGTRDVSRELTEKVEQAIEKLDYQPNAVAKSLATNKTNTIGLIVGDISNPYFSDIARGVEDEAIDNGYSVIVCNSDETKDKESLYLKVLRQKQVDGLVIAPAGESDKNIRQLEEHGSPFVFIDRFIPGFQVDRVVSDNVEGAYNATKHLIDRGHERIGIILGIRSISATRERYTGYRKALYDGDIEANQNLVKWTNSKFEGGYKATKEFINMEQKPTALFTTNGVLSLGASKAINESDITCPDDISVMGFDDIEPLTSLSPPLSTVSQDSKQLGSEAVDLLLSRIEKGNDSSQRQLVRLPTEVKLRGSIRPLK